VSKRKQFDTAKVIAEVRRLQLERTRIETLRRAQAHQSEQVREHQVLAELDACLDGWRRALLAPTGLSPTLALNGAGAVASGRVAHLQAQQATRDAAARVDEKRTEMLGREHQAGVAEQRLKDARRRFQRSSEEREASRLEDMHVLYGDRL
jgi:hypothetical protein